VTAVRIGLGEFGFSDIKEKHERKGINPATGEDMKLVAGRVATFKCSGKWRDKINKSE
jgi:integration host factor subunit alpha